ncbi:response regulator transcription factor [Paratissierella segnis]|jgi:DNA-binding response OmpR family regulator|uniref:Response regulator transcription factor n=1 Tax=Paratissierella segnis TaxID=2763679 RepID=A0A926IIY9_9FIRM|nr:response regulator transcription factor [Paratissierella segnis]MBC8586846.1 response regulator transcription factor [Paratissierella segnis]
MYKIAIIDDDKGIREELGILLKNNGYEVCLPTDFSEIPSMIQRENPHLILLDINLPEQDGFHLCIQIRSSTNIPIIFITSRDNRMDELQGITLGADDFITKPFNVSILLARMTRILNRVYGESLDQKLIHKGVQLHLESGMIEYNDNKMELTKNELKILYILFKNKGTIVSRMEIMDYLWDNSIFIDDNTLSVNITRIRSKLKELGIYDFICTKHGQGYMI